MGNSMDGAGDARRRIRDTVEQTIATLIQQGHNVEPLLESVKYSRFARYTRACYKAVFDETKTADAMARMIKNAMKELYDGGEVGDFLDRMADIINQQLTRAWREALRYLELDPNLVNTDYADDVQDAILHQFDFVDSLAQDIVDASVAGASFDQFTARADLWANRYEEEKNAAVLKIETELGGKLAWRLGETEEHCETCAMLNGKVAYASEWDQAGLHPQGAPNDALACGGWRCDCRLELTDERRSPNVLNTLFDAATMANVRSVSPMKARYDLALMALADSLNAVIAALAVAPPTINVAAPVVNIAPPPAPVVNVAPPEVTVEPPQVTVQLPPQRPMQITRDNEGRINGLTPKK